MTTRGRPGSGAHRSGLTMLEVVMSTAMLTVAAAMILGGISFGTNLALRESRRLEAMEVAHRIVVTHIRDPRELIGQPKRVRFGDHMYRFEIDEDVLIREMTEEAGPIRRSGRKAQDMDFAAMLSAQLFLVRVSVYPDEIPAATGQAPLAALSRVYTLMSYDEEDLLDWLTQRMGSQLDR